MTKQHADESYSPLRSEEIVSIGNKIVRAAQDADRFSQARAPPLQKGGSRGGAGREGAAPIRNLGNSVTQMPRKHLEMEAEGSQVQLAHNPSKPTVVGRMGGPGGPEQGQGEKGTVHRTSRWGDGGSNMPENITDNTGFLLSISERNEERICSLVSHQDGRNRMTSIKS
ncbi:hypothetical protein Bbelb_357530 [Branchiostoma belcheri]|nr:hypothetical protein Bbelb_385660 [Branchiostoma belcheri]KAI8486518.1 hypothetical protein Bbelb_357530 [Branchiostoma belcheri]